MLSGVRAEDWLSAWISCLHATSTKFVS